MIPFPQHICQVGSSERFWLQATFTTDSTLVLSNASSTAQFYGEREFRKLASSCMSHTCHDHPRHRSRQWLGSHIARSMPSWHAPCTLPASKKMRSSFLCSLLGISAKPVATCLPHLLNGLVLKNLGGSIGMT